MPKPSHPRDPADRRPAAHPRKRLLAASVRDIVTAAAVRKAPSPILPNQGQFGLAVLERYYYGYIKELMERTLLNEKTTALERIRSYSTG